MNNPVTMNNPAAPDNVGGNTPGSVPAANFAGRLGHGLARRKFLEAALVCLGASVITGDLSPAQSPPIAPEASPTPLQPVRQATKRGAKRSAKGNDDDSASSPPHLAPPKQGTLEFHFREARWMRPGRPGKVESIILHSTDGIEIGDVATLSGETDRRVSSHYYVTKLGKIYHFVDEMDTAFQAGICISPRYENERSIGIEQEHFDGRERWTPLQVQATAKLVAAIEQRHGTLDIKSHAFVAAPHGRKVDPEDYPWGHFYEAVDAAKKTHWTMKKAR